MNWTGGSLQRTKHANKSVVQKQKAYFARARTHLQNGPKSPATPFRPTYLQKNDNLELVGYLPSFGSSSVRHTGHPPRHRYERKPSLSVQSLQHGGELIPTPGDRQARKWRGNVSMRPLHQDPQGEQRRKRNVDDTDPETQLLEANRKRLLDQHDWIGVAPSRPVTLRFLSSKEKSKLGKRRKMEGRHGATARHRDDVDFVTQPFQPAGDQPVGGFVGAIRKNPNEIRIRIGSDALTTACSTEPNDHDQSHASSDVMLFDQQTHDTERRATHETAQLDVQEAHPLEHLAIKRHKPTNHQDIPLVTEQCRQDCSSVHHVHNGDSRDNVVARRRTSRQTSSELVIRSSCERKPGGEGSARGLQDMQPFGGVSQSLRLIFSGSTSSRGPHNRTTIHDKGHGGTDYAFEAPHAGESNNGHLQHIGNRIELPSESEAAPAASIVDERPWKLFLDIPEKSSSHATSANDSEKSVVHQHPTTKTREAECTSWSQHATQGDHTSSSLISASLPSLRREARKCPSAHELRTGMDRVNQAAPRTLNDDEQIWQDFVLGSSVGSSPQSRHEPQDYSDQRQWKGSSGYLPLSVAVSSISSPFKPISGRAPRMHYDVHDAARFAPPRSGSITSPATVRPRFVEKLSDGNQGDFTAERSMLGESVTHASLLANASGEDDLLCSRMFSHTETSRSGLEHPSHSGASLYERAQANRGETGRERERYSVHDVPSNDDGKLHLVDADSLW